MGLVGLIKVITKAFNERLVLELLLMELACVAIILKGIIGLKVIAIADLPSWAPWTLIVLLLCSAPNSFLVWWDALLVLSLSTLFMQSPNNLPPMLFQVTIVFLLVGGYGLFMKEKDEKKLKKQETEEEKHE